MRDTAAAASCPPPPTRCCLNLASRPPRPRCARCTHHGADLSGRNCLLSQQGQRWQDHRSSRGWQATGAGHWPAAVPELCMPLNDDALRGNRRLQWFGDRRAGLGGVLAAAACCGSPSRQIAWRLPPPNHLRDPLISPYLAEAPTPGNTAQQSAGASSWPHNTACLQLVALTLARSESKLANSCLLQQLLRGACRTRPPRAYERRQLPHSARHRRRVQVGDVAGGRVAVAGGVCVCNPAVQRPRPLRHVFVAAPDAVGLPGGAGRGRAELRVGHAAAWSQGGGAGGGLAAVPLPGQPPKPPTCGHSSTRAACGGSSSPNASAAPCMPSSTSVPCTIASCSSTASGTSSRI